MATLNINISKDNNGNLYMDNPAGSDAIELGNGGVIQLSIGSGFSGTAQFDKLRLEQSGTNAQYDLTVSQGGAASQQHTFPNGAVMWMGYGSDNNSVMRMNISNDGNDPTTGEEDLEFSVWISDANGQHLLDPEIRVKSGTAPGTAAWTTQSSS